jgi:hypothetical protein
MSQTFHNYITVRGDKDQRIRVSASVLAATPGNWDWIKIQIEQQSGSSYKDPDLAITLWDFYSHNSPWGLGEMSSLYPGLQFNCHLMDLTAEVEYFFDLVKGEESNFKEQCIEWGREQVVHPVVTMNVKGRAKKVEDSDLDNPEHYQSWPWKDADLKGPIQGRVLHQAGDDIVFLSGDRNPEYYLVKNNQATFEKCPRPKEDDLDRDPEFLKEMEEMEAALRKAALRKEDDLDQDPEFLKEMEAELDKGSET